jgi:hypothetical protein
MKEPSRDLSPEKRTRLLKKVRLLNEEQREAMFMLICEHARLNDEFEYQPGSFALPYDLRYSDGELTFDVKLLPRKLQYILWKFVRVVQHSEK